MAAPTLVLPASALRSRATVTMLPAPESAIGTPRR